MIPEDDPLWPTCDEHAGEIWCAHIRDALHKGRDADAIVTGIRVCIPVSPKTGAFAEVSIDREELIPGTARMYLVRAQPFDPEEDLIYLGLWSKGDGRLAIAAVLRDWMRASQTKRCKWSSHGIRQEQALQKMDKEQGIANEYSLAVHSACVFCWTALTPDPDPSGLSAVTQDGRKSNILGGLRST